MSHHILNILRQYQRSAASTDWVMASLVSKQRSSYRNPGAIMLINPEGESFGLLSGGCLEQHIRQQARKVASLGRPQCVVYDSSDDDNIAAELGLGCNGRVEILLQQVGTGHHQVLKTLLERLEAGVSSYVAYCYASNNIDDMRQLLLLDESGQCLLQALESPVPELPDEPFSRHRLMEESGRSWSLNKHTPPPELWIVGGGVDAVPVADIAIRLGWKTSVVDHRPGYALAQNFNREAQILRIDPMEFDGNSACPQAVIVMSHNLNMDASWLRKISAHWKPAYIGLLGPEDRKNEVFDLAGISETGDFAQSVHGPMGFDIGGDTPESVALSVLAECHQILFKAKINC